MCKGRRQRWQASHDCGFRRHHDDFGRGLGAGSAPPSRVQRAVDRNRHLEHRDVDAECGGRLAHGWHDARCLHRLAGAGGHHAAGGATGAARRRARRHHRPAQAADRRQRRAHRHRRSTWFFRMAWPGHAGDPADLHVPRRRRVRADCAGLAGHRALPGAAQGPAGGNLAQQRRHQHQPRSRAGARRHHHRRTGIGCALLAQCAEHAGRHRCPPVVAPGENTEHHLPPERFHSALRMAGATPATTDT